MGEQFASGDASTNGFAPSVSTPAFPDVVAMPLLLQGGEVYVGPGSKKEAQLLGLGLKKLRSRDMDDVAAAKRYALDLSVKQIMLRQQQSHQQNQQKQAMYTQALSLMGRVYIGSISFEVRESDIKKAFENFGPVKAINMSYDNSTGNHKGFAFLEFEIPEAAVIAQDAMNGLMMGGRNLKVSLDMHQKVGRPANMPQAQPIIDMIMTEATKYHRIYVASVHPDLSESDLKSVFEAFGQVTKCQLARTNAATKGAHRGFGYIEFTSKQACLEAIAGMNMFDLGGQFLRVGKCITPPEALNYLMPQTQSALPSAAAMAAASITAKIQATEVIQKSSSPSQTSSYNPSAPAFHAIGVDPTTGLFVTAPLPDGPSPCLSLTNELTPIPPHLASKAPNAIDPPKPLMEVKKEESPIPPPPPPSHPPPSLMSVNIPPPASYQSPSFPPPPSLIPPIPPPPPPSISSSLPPPTPSDDMELDDDSSTPPSSLVPRKKGFGEFATEAPPPGVFVPPGTSTENTNTGEENRKKKKNKKKRDKTQSGLSILERIKVQKNEEGVKATYGITEADQLMAIQEEEARTQQLAIMGARDGGDIQSMALSLIDGNQALVAVQKRRDQKEREEKEQKEKQKKHKIKPPKKQTGPKLNTPAAMAAATKAGELKDAIVNANATNEDATLASQEMMQIRGNDARHLLMRKLMRVNRSCVVLLKNMVTPEDIDEFLEEEIKEECGKYGVVEEVVIASEPEAGIAKIFVRFSEAQEADTAKEALDKRFFGGRSIEARVYDQALFEHGDYTG